MKIIINDDKIIVFLNDLQYINYNENEIENSFNLLLNKLEKKFDIDIKNISEVCIYKDNNYGIILEIKYEEVDCFFDFLDININVFKNNYFLYKIDYNYIDKSIINGNSIYKIKDDFYIKLKRKLDKKIFYKILEYSDIIYGEKALKIENIGKKVNI